ncbi:hypothetical protein BDR26DRAFT_554198 [Obelidium mucronatum]|nr:hypothetical protein BDR26DRAFT_554198 [Obelidium mucronatum]
MRCATLGWIKSMIWSGRLNDSRWDLSTQMSQLPQTGPPSKQRGRKPIQDTGNSDPTVSKRTVQLREAQRAHRERKVQYLQDLELKVKELTEEASLVKKLKARIQQLEFEAGLREPLSGTSNTSLLQPAAAGVLLNEIGASNCGSCVLKEFQVNELKKECQEWKEKAMSLMSMQ